MGGKILGTIRPQMPGVDLAVMAKNAVLHLEGEIPAGTLALKVLKKLYRLNIMLKRTQSVLATEGRQNAFTFMAERRMADIVTKGDGFDQILVEPEKSTDGPGDPRDDLDMQNPVGDMIVVHQREHLGFIDIAGIGLGVEDTVRILGKGLPVILEQFGDSTHCGATAAGKAAETGGLQIIKILPDGGQPIPMRF
jgi:hypothetical protein